MLGVFVRLVFCPRHSLQARDDHLAPLSCDTRARSIAQVACLPHRQTDRRSEDVFDNRFTTNIYRLTRHSCTRSAETKLVLNILKNINDVIILPLKKDVI